MKGVTRRDFVKGTVVAGLVTALPYSRVQGANDRIRVGFEGRMTTFVWVWSVAAVAV
jgi:hypothetical protein